LLAVNEMIKSPELNHPRETTGEKKGGRKAASGRKRKSAGELGTYLSAFPAALPRGARGRGLPSAACSELGGLLGCFFLFLYFSFFFLSFFLSLFCGPFAQAGGGGLGAAPAAGAVQGAGRAARGSANCRVIASHGSGTGAGRLGAQQINALLENKQANKQKKRERSALIERE